MIGQSVSSSSLRKVGYDEVNSRLYIEFVSKSFYVYHGVDRALYDGLISAESQGKYFHKFIRGNMSISCVKLQRSPFEDLTEAQMFDEDRWLRMRKLIVVEGFEPVDELSNLIAGW